MVFHLSDHIWNMEISVWKTDLDINEVHWITYSTVFSIVTVVIKKKLEKRRSHTVEAALKQDYLCYHQMLQVECLALMISFF